MKFKEHINVSEFRPGCAILQHSVRNQSKWDKRLLCIGDSMVAIGAFSKGRSSSAPILHVLRKGAAAQLGVGIRPYFRWIQTDRNHIDGPSRGYLMGVAPKEREKGGAKINLQVMDEAILRAADSEVESPGATEKVAVILKGLVVRVFRFVHLFSGHLREADLEEWLAAYFADAGYMIEVVNVDVGFLGDHNLADDGVGAEWRRRAAAGEFDGGHAGPPCEHGAESGSGQEDNHH